MWTVPGLPFGGTADVFREDGAALASPVAGGQEPRCHSQTGLHRATGFATCFCGCVSTLKAVYFKVVSLSHILFIVQPKQARMWYGEKKTGWGFLKGKNRGRPTYGGGPYRFCAQGLQEGAVEVAGNGAI